MSGMGEKTGHRRGSGGIRSPSPHLGVNGGTIGLRVRSDLI
jgi:hypothetical protein